jgi:hypothetical protein
MAVRYGNNSTLVWEPQLLHSNWTLRFDHPISLMRSAPPYPRWAGGYAPSWRESNGYLRRRGVAETVLDGALWLPARS